jgi:hypothetical protein
MDDAVLVDVALQLLRGELAEYEDFCPLPQDGGRVRRPAGGQHRIHPRTLAGRDRAVRTAIDHPASGMCDPNAEEHHAGDARASLFHVI